jgi:hypothetical protein
VGPLELTLNGAQTQWNIAKFVVEVTNRIMIENAVCLQFFFVKSTTGEQERNKRGAREEQERNT